MHKHQICGRSMVQNCSKPTIPSRSTGVRTPGWCHSVGNQMVEVAKEVMETQIILKLPSKMRIYAENMRYAHFAEICEKCGNKWSMWQSHSHKTDMSVYHVTSPSATVNWPTAVIFSLFYSSSRFYLLSETRPVGSGGALGAYAPPNK